jgi:TP901 family phage tail tape measure protein
MGAEILGRLAILFGLESSLDEDLNDAQNELKTFSSKVSSAGIGLTAGVTAPIVAATGAMVGLSLEAANFESNMGSVFTLLPDISGDAMSEMSDQVLELSKNMAVMPNEVVPALYQALSAGVDKENVFTFMEAATKASIGGMTDLETAVDGLTSVVNAYGQDVIDVGRASDIMFTTVRLGKTTFEEMSSSLYNVLPYASSLGVTFEDLGAAMAAMTMQGVPTAQVTTQLKAAFVELSDNGSQVSKTFQELTGTTFKQFIAGGGDLQGALQLLEKAANDAGIDINNMFSSAEAGAAALTLTGKGTESFSKALNDMANSAGATEKAFETMNETTSRSLESLKVAFATAGIEIGAAFLPIINDTIVPVLRDVLVPLLTEKVAPAIQYVATIFSELPAPVQLGIFALVGLVAAVGPALLVLGSLAGAYTALFGPLGIFAGLTWAALAPYLLAVGIIAAVVAALYLLEKRYGIVSDVVHQFMVITENLYNWLKVKIPAAIDTTLTWFGSLSDSTVAMIPVVGMLIVAWRHLDEIVDIAKYVYLTVSGYFGKLANTVVTVLDSILDAFEAVARTFGFNFNFNVKADVDKAKADVSGFLNYLTTEQKKAGSIGVASAAETGGLSTLSSAATSSLNTYLDALNQSTATYQAEAAAINSSTSARKQSIEDAKTESDLIRSGAYNPNYTGTIYAGRSSGSSTTNVTNYVSVGSINNSGDYKTLEDKLSASVIKVKNNKTSGVF